MENQPRQPNGGDHPPAEANSYGTDDPETQAHIENARIDAARERRRDRAQFERHLGLGVNAEDAVSFIEFRDLTANHRDEPLRREEEAHWPTHETDETAEKMKLCEPLIYVADMASAKRGVSHGLWIAADQTPDELNDDITAMLASSPTPGATEWTVQATEDFAGLDLRGFTDTSLISVLGNGVAEHGPAFAAWVAINGTDERSLLEQFDDFYVGNYESMEAWMREVADDLGWQREKQRITDPLLSPYVTLDYTAMARDASATWDTVMGVDGRLHVFLR